ncbi:MAG: phage holin family protein [Anaerolineae bacterium]|jgi:putative membrane protein
MKLLIRWVIVAIALVVAMALIPGIRVDDTNAWIAVGVMAVVLGLVNAVIRPILAFLSCGCIVATLGLFMLVINGITLWLSSWVAQNWLNIGFVVDGFWPAFWGAIVVSVVSFVLSLILIDDRDKKRESRS